MDFNCTTAQTALIQNVADFVTHVVNPALAPVPDPANFDHSLWKTCAEHGLLACGMPEPWGWADRSDYLSTILVLESVGYACTDNALPFALAAQGCTVQHTLLHHGSDAQIDAYLPGCIAGDLLGSHAMTEPAAGSDSSAVALTAERQNDGYVLNGEKLMITLAPVADFHVVFATINPAAGRWGITSFIVDSNTPGLDVSGPMKKLGLESIPMGRLRFDNCFIPESARLGPEGAGAAIAHKSLEVERTAILASQVGRMRRQLESAVQHAKQRQQFGKPIDQFQAVSHRLADMRVRLETAQLLLYKTAWKLDQQQNAILESSMLKLLISESFLASSMDAMRVHGGYAYIDDHHSGIDTQDALGGVLYAGTSDIQRNIIAGLLDQ
ncbi:MAG: acyl-CoA dehydrogenase family protein [Granulosicoccus sp.]